MSFRLFVYYCALCGAWAAWLGWALGRLVAPSGDLARALVQGLLLGMLVALALGWVDALGNLARRQAGLLLTRVLVAVAIGCVGGLLGAGLGQLLVRTTHLGLLTLVGWALTGLLIGISVGVYDLVTCLRRKEDPAGARRKVRNGLLGGAVGGLVGSILYLVLRKLLELTFRKPPDELLSASAVGFVALGLSIGLAIGLAQVILREAWLRVEEGFRPGREMLLSKAETTLGRAETCDVGLFGDQAVERLHARITREGSRFVVADAGTPAGTYVNDEPVTQPRPLRSGDRIRIGKSVLRFGEREKPVKASEPDVKPRRERTSTPLRRIPENPFDN